MIQHWHAYSYIGRAYSDGEIREGKAHKTHEAVPTNHPPIEVRDWLTDPKRRVVNTFTKVAAAMIWLEDELIAKLPVDEEAFPVKTRLEYSRSRLGQRDANDVVHTYYSKSGDYVSRALIPCPWLADPGESVPACPLG